MTYAGLTVAYWAVVVAALLPIGCAGVAKWGQIGRARRDGGFDNHNPRAWLARQSRLARPRQRRPGQQL